MNKLPLANACDDHSKAFGISDHDKECAFLRMRINMFPRGMTTSRHYRGAAKCWLRSDRKTTDDHRQTMIDIKDADVLHWLAYHDYHLVSSTDHTTCNVDM